MMKNKKTSLSFESEFKEFMETEEIVPPQSLSKAIQHKIHSALNPSIQYVFAKLALIHLVIGTFTLLFCPQLGLSFRSGMGLMYFLMQYGDAFCMFGCGVFFLGTSALVASIILCPEEIRIVRKTQFFQFTVLAILSAAILLTIGPHDFGTLAILWIAGSIIGALTTMEIGWAIRSYVKL